MESLNNVSNCLNIAFRKDHEYIHDVASDENGIWLFNKIKQDKTSEFGFVRNPGIYVKLNRGICNLTARLRDSRCAIIGAEFILDYENGERLSINALSTSANISLLVLCVNGHFRVYSSQDPPSFHIWSIIEQFTCNLVINNFVTSFSMVSNLQIINNQIYNNNMIAIGTFNGGISVFCRFNEVIDETKNIENVIKNDWNLLYDTKDINMKSSNKDEDEIFTSLLKNEVLDIKWCPNYARDYDILATSQDKYNYSNIDNGLRRISHLPWIGIWRWELIINNNGDEEKPNTFTNNCSHLNNTFFCGIMGRLKLIYLIINHEEYPTNSITWDIKGTEFIACTEYNVTRFIQNDDMNDFDNFVSTESLIYFTNEDFRNTIASDDIIQKENNQVIKNRGFPRFIKYIKPI
ncbi:WD domain G-beta repeat family protein [Cryptosporidium felis]|nr:WD domain G-beta repeat family protein [Cryptosporidium felis]